MELLARIFGIVLKQWCWLKMVAVHLSVAKDATEQVTGTIAVHKAEWTCQTICGIMRISNCVCINAHNSKQSLVTE